MTDILLLPARVRRSVTFVGSVERVVTLPANIRPLAAFVGKVRRILKQIGAIS